MALTSDRATGTPNEENIIRIISELKNDPYTIRYKINLLYDLLYPYIQIRIKNLQITVIDPTLSKFKMLSYDLHKMIALCALIKYDDDVQIPIYYSALFNILLQKINIINELLRSDYNKEKLDISQFTEKQQDIILNTLPNTERLKELYKQILISLYSIWYDANKIYNITITINDDLKETYNSIIDTEYPSQKIAYNEFIKSVEDISIYETEGLKLKKTGEKIPKVKTKKSIKLLTQDIQDQAVENAESNLIIVPLLNAEIQTLRATLDVTNTEMEHSAKLAVDATRKLSASEREISSLTHLNTVLKRSNKLLSITADPEPLIG